MKKLGKNLGRKFSDFHTASCHNCSGLFDVELNFCFTKIDILHFEFFVLLLQTYCFQVKKSDDGLDWEKNIQK